MIQWPHISVSLVLIIALFFILLGRVLNCIPSCRRFASLSHFISLGVIVGCTAGVVGEFGYDFIERWLFRTVPIRSLTNFIDSVFDGGYAPLLGMISGAAAGIWFWYDRPATHETDSH